MTVTINGTTGITTPGLDASGTNKFATTIGVGNATPSASGAGITFPAAQSASSDANTLDDYEEGTFTPTLSSTATPPTVSVYQNRNGIYTKIGNIVCVTVQIRATVSSAGTGTPTVTGLPFTSAGWQEGVALGLTTLLTAASSGIGWWYVNGTQVNILAGTYSTAAEQYMTFTATYRVA